MVTVEGTQIRRDKKVPGLVWLKEANFTIQGFNLHIQFYEARREIVLTLTWFM